MKPLILLTFTLFFSSTLLANDLGTSKEMFDQYHSNYVRAVTASFPRFDFQTVERKLQQIAKKYPNGFDPVKIKSMREMQKTFNLPAQEVGSGQTFVEDKQGRFAYERDQTSGKLAVHYNRESLTPLSLQEAQREMGKIQQNHLSLMNQIGIDRSQIQFNFTDFILLQSGPKSDNGRLTRSMPPVVDATFTYGLRHLEGLMIDGSYLKVFSKNAKTLGGVDLTWPKFVFHPAIKRFSLKEKETLLKEIQKTVLSTMSKEDEINVRMAVVLRPVQLRGNGQVFIPALKVGVLSKKGEAGNMFYVDLLSERLSYLNSNASDNDEGGQ